MRMHPLGLRRRSPRARTSVRPRLEAMEDRLLLTVFTVDRAADDANVGSLRWAIGQANAGSGGDTIEFSLPTTAGVATINLSASLPAITKPVTIDGTSQPTYSGRPVVVINGAGAADGLQVAG